MIVLSQKPVNPKAVLILALVPSVEIELYARWNTIQQFATVHLAYKEMHIYLALKLAVDQMMIVETEKSVTLHWDHLKKRNANHSVSRILVYRVLHALPLTTEKLALAIIHCKEMDIQLVMSVRMTVL
jgi:hypothetical protein